MTKGWGRGVRAWLDADLPAGSPQPTGLEYTLLGLSVAAFLLIGWLGREPTMIAGGDELIYLELSRSLEQGTYREIFRAGTPLQLQYPPGYPAWLLVVRSIIGENLDGVKLVNLLLMAGTLVLLYPILRRFLGAVLALAAVVLLALSPGMLMNGGSMMSESLFLFFATVVLTRMVPGHPGIAGGPAVLILLAVVALLTRSVGLSVLLAVGYWLWSTRRTRSLLVWAIAGLVAGGGWFGYTLLAKSDPTVRSYAGDFTTGIAPTTSNAVADMASRLGQNLVRYGTRELQTVLSLPTIPATVADNLVWLALLALLFPIGFLLLWRRWPVAAVFLAAYGVLILIWPWTDGRLLVPTLPFLLLVLLLGARQATARLPLTGRALALGGLVLLLGLGTWSGTWQRLTQYRDCDRSNPYSSPGCYNENTLAIIRGAQYLRDHSDSGAIVLTNKPASVHFLSDRLTEHVSVVLRTPEGRLIKTLEDRKIGFVLLNQTIATRVSKRLLEACGRLEVVARFQPRTLVLALQPQPVPDAPACQEMAPFAEEGDELAMPGPP